MLPVHWEAQRCAFCLFIRDAQPDRIWYSEAYGRYIGRAYPGYAVGWKTPEAFAGLLVVYRKTM